MRMFHLILSGANIVLSIVTFICLLVNWKFLRRHDQDDTC